MNKDYKNNFIKNVEMKESEIPISKCRPQGATLCKVRSLIFRHIVFDDISYIIKTGINTILDWVFPSNIYCIVCGNLIDQSRPYSMCDSCLRTVHWSFENTCDRCGKPLPQGYEEDCCSDCQSREHLFLKGYSCVEYGEQERNLIHRFKYKEQPFLGKPMAEAMVDRILPEGMQVDLILPVPMYLKKEHKRGYNQADLLAKHMARCLQGSYSRNLLQRVVATEPMNALSLEERQQNIKDAFGVAKGREGEIFGKNILLIDDIYTTGSTADACSEVLKAAGAANIYFYGFAAGK